MTTLDAAVLEQIRTERSPHRGVLQAVCAAVIAGVAAAVVPVGMLGIASTLGPSDAVWGLCILIAVFLFAVHWLIFTRLAVTVTPHARTLHDFKVGYPYEWAEVTGEPSAGWEALEQAVPDRVRRQMQDARAAARDRLQQRGRLARTAVTHR